MTLKFEPLLKTSTLVSFSTLLACQCALYSVPAQGQQEQARPVRSKEASQSQAESEPTEQSRTAGATSRTEEEKNKVPLVTPPATSSKTKAKVKANINVTGGASGTNQSSVKGTTPTNKKSFVYTGIARARPKATSSFPIPILVKTADPYSTALSTDALQMAKMLRLKEKLYEIQNLQGNLKSYQPKTEESSTAQTSVGDENRHERTILRAELAASKIDVIEVLENVRLQIDFVCAEIEEEEAGNEELLQAYTVERDHKVNEANLLAFRTNGVLWAVGEALDIPTATHPMLSVPSGAIGIVAGIIPSVFSIYAVRSLNGNHHSRNAYPNMLSKIYNYPTIARNEYPEAVWSYLNTSPVNDARTRRQIMMDHWLTDKNIHVFEQGENEKTLDIITGMSQERVNIGVLTDRLTMLREVKAVVLQMTRPLLELSMVVRGQKQLTASDL